MAPCEACETPGDPFYCGLPGVLARIEDGKPAGKVERCDACGRFATDQAASIALERHVERTAAGRDDPAGGMYLQLFHGRRDPAQEMDNWGEDGPIFHCPSFVHVTYATTIKLGDAQGRIAWLTISADDLVFYDGWWYGDFSVFLPDERECRKPSFLSRLATFDPVLAIPPN